MQFSVGLKIFCYGWGKGGGGGGEIRTCTSCCLRDIMLTGGPNYMMIRRAILGKVHGRGVKEI